MRKKGRSRIAVLLGIGAICGMLGTTGRYVYAENMTTATAAIEESTGDITPATGDADVRIKRKRALEKQVP